MDMWKGKFALVTGASSGIGASLIQKLAKNGINVIALARRIENIEKIINDVGEVTGKIYARKCDIADFESIQETFKWIEDNFGHINILINNAGFFPDVKILDESEEAINSVNQVINTNLTGVVNCTRKSVGLMKKSGESSMIINIGSIVARTVPFISLDFNIYPSTKYAVLAFNEVVRQELIKDGNMDIRISGIHPGHVKTEMTSRDFFKPFVSLSPDEVSDVVLSVLTTPKNVNIFDMIIKPVGELF